MGYLLLDQLRCWVRKVGVAELLAKDGCLDIASIGTLGKVAERAAHSGISQRWRAWVCHCLSKGRWISIINYSIIGSRVEDGIESGDGIGKISSNLIAKSIEIIDSRPDSVASSAPLEQLSQRRVKVANTVVGLFNQIRRNDIGSNACSDKQNTKDHEGVNAAAEDWGFVGFDADGGSAASGLQNSYFMPQQL